MLKSLESYPAVEIEITIKASIPASLSPKASKFDVTILSSKVHEDSGAQTDEITEYHVILISLLYSIYQVRLSLS